jgi:putative ABC transport system ATP-binding protein
MTLVSIRGLHKDYPAPGGRTSALAGISLAIGRGAVCAIVGPSGSGKSTLLGILGGLDAPSAGEVYVGVFALHRMSPAERTRYRAAHVGFVFQSNNLVPVLSAAENVALPLTLHGWSARARMRRVMTLLDALGLRAEADRRPGELSGGQQQRVAIARALAAEPMLVLADEPTAHLDSQTGRGVMAVLRAINRDRKATLVFSTHDPALESVADQRIVLRDGAVVPLSTGPEGENSWERSSPSRRGTCAGIHAAPPLLLPPSAWGSSS